MLKAIDKVAEEFLNLIETKKAVRIISHHDTDGITSATILAKTLRRLDKKFSILIVKSLDKEIIKQELKNQNQLLFFTDLGSGNLEHFQNLQNPIFILDHHEINKEKLNSKIKIINPHLFSLGDACPAAGICYLFSKAISEKNKDLAKLAMIGIIGDRHESNISKINQQIINDLTKSEELTIKKGLAIYPATRPLRRAIEWSTSPYIQGITGNSVGVLNLLRESNINPTKSLIELNQEEMSRLITAIMVKNTGQNKKENIIGNLYILKFFNKKEDVREISVLINACARLGFPDIAIAYCLEHEKAKTYAQDIYVKYKQELISGLRTVEKIEKIRGNGFIIINAKNEIKDAIVGTICSMLSSSTNYEEGTILIGMAYNKDKIKVSARIAGRKGRNLKEVLEKTVVNLKVKYPDIEAEVGGHKFAAGCLLEKEREQEFIKTLKQNLEIEVMKI